MGESSRVKEKSAVRDQPTSAKQFAVAQWFAKYKGIPLPPEVSTSYFRWWGWLQTNVSDIDREDAHAVRIDFGLRPFDEENPVRVIAKLKYASEVKAASNLNNGDLQALYGAAATNTDMQLDVEADDIKALISRKKIELATCLLLDGVDPTEIRTQVDLPEGDFVKLIQYVCDNHPDFE